MVHHEKALKFLKLFFCLILNTTLCLASQLFRGYILPHNHSSLARLVQLPDCQRHYRTVSSYSGLLLIQP